MKACFLFISILILSSCATLFNKQSSVTPEPNLTEVHSTDSTVVENISDTLDSKIDSLISVVDSIVELKDIVTTIITPVTDDSIHLVKYATNFKAKQLNLTNSILENPELNVFLSKKDKSGFKSNPNFDYFITMIVLKQYELHITKFHQGFDLFTMKAGNAGFIVSSFVELSKLPAGIKGINSSYILDYIASNDKLKNEPSIAEIVNKINNLPK
jgi:hypothetical protein